MLAWEPGVKAIAVKCDLCYFREEGPACMQTCPTKTLFLISDESIEQANRKKTRNGNDGFSCRVKIKIYCLFTR